MVRVGHDVGAIVLRDLHGRDHLLLRELRHVDGVEGAGAAPTRHDLQLGGPIAEVVASGLEHLWPSIHDVREAYPLELVHGTWLVKATASVSMAASLAQEAPGREDPRPRDAAAVHGPGDAQDVAARVAAGREALLEVVHEVLAAHCAHGHLVEGVPSLQHALLDRQVAVHVDKARQQRAARAVHGHAAFPGREARAHGRDQVVHDQHVLGTAKRL
mmetsp:Transcript_50362/g.146105  ORF Transcript_50362/g.146105 Transcript_50362/m.146105 type:complete len:216 (-) Transcript_50362:139-786(-)